MKFSTKDIEAMRESAEGHFMDVATRLIYQVTFDEYAQSVISMTEGETFECGLEYNRGIENHGSDMTIVEYQVLMRYPTEVELDPKDRVEVTSFRGDVTSGTYEIATPVQRGISANRVGLNKVAV